MDVQGLTLSPHSSLPPPIKEEGILLSLILEEI